MGVVRTLVTSVIVGAAGSARAGAGAAELTLRRAPSLLAVSTRAALASGTDAARAQAVFRDELLTLFDDVAELAWRQARRARLELGERTGPSPEAALATGQRAPATVNGVPRRHVRVKP